MYFWKFLLYFTILHTFVRAGNFSWISSLLSDVIGVYSYNDCHISLIDSPIISARGTIELVSIDRFSRYNSEFYPPIMSNKAHENLILWILKIPVRERHRNGIHFYQRYRAQYFQYHLSIAFSPVQRNWYFMDANCHCWTFIIIDIDKTGSYRNACRHRKLGNQVYYVTVVFLKTHRAVHYFHMRIIREKSHAFGNILQHLISSQFFNSAGEIIVARSN